MKRKSASGGNLPQNASASASKKTGGTRSMQDSHGEHSVLNAGINTTPFQANKVTGKTGVVSAHEDQNNGEGKVRKLNLRATSESFVPSPATVASLQEISLQTVTGATHVIATEEKANATMDMTEGVSAPLPHIFPGSHHGNVLAPRLHAEEDRARPPSKISYIYVSQPPPNPTTQLRKQLDWLLGCKPFHGVGAVAEENAHGGEINYIGVSVRYGLDDMQPSVLALCLADCCLVLHRNSGLFQTHMLSQFMAGRFLHGVTHRPYVFVGLDLAMDAMRLFCMELGPTAGSASTVPTGPSVHGLKPKDRGKKCTTSGTAVVPASVPPSAPPAIPLLVLHKGLDLAPLFARVYGPMDVEETIPGGGPPTAIVVGDKRLFGCNVWAQAVDGDLSPDHWLDPVIDHGRIERAVLQAWAQVQIHTELVHRQEPDMPFTLLGQDRNVVRVLLQRILEAQRLARHFCQSTPISLLDLENFSPATAGIVSATITSRGHSVPCGSTIEFVVRRSGKDIFHASGLAIRAEDESILSILLHPSTFPNGANEQTKCAYPNAALLEFWKASRNDASLRVIAALPRQCRPPAALKYSMQLCRDAIRHCFVTEDLPSHAAADDIFFAVLFSQSICNTRVALPVSIISGNAYGTLSSINNSRAAENTVSPLSEEVLSAVAACTTSLDAVQREGVHNLFRGPLTVCRGAAGTGKTQTLVAMVMTLSRIKVRSLVVVPSITAARSLIEGLHVLHCDTFAFVSSFDVHTLLVSDAARPWLDRFIISCPFPGDIVAAPDSGCTAGADGKLAVKQASLTVGKRWKDIFRPEEPGPDIVIMIHDAFARHVLSSETPHGILESSSRFSSDEAISKIIKTSTIGGLFIDDADQIWDGHFMGMCAALDSLAYCAIAGNEMISLPYDSKASKLAVVCNGMKSLLTSAMDHPLADAYKVAKKGKKKVAGLEQGMFMTNLHRKYRLSTPVAAVIPSHTCAINQGAGPGAFQAADTIEWSPTAPRSVSVQIRSPQMTSTAPRPVDPLQHIATDLRSVEAAGATRLKLDTKGDILESIPCQPDILRTTLKSPILLTTLAAEIISAIRGILGAVVDRQLQLNWLHQSLAQRGYTLAMLESVWPLLSCANDLECVGIVDGSGQLIPVVRIKRPVSS